MKYTNEELYNEALRLLQREGPDNSKRRKGLLSLLNEVIKDKYTLTTQQCEELKRLYLDSLLWHDGDDISAVVPMLILTTNDEMYEGIRNKMPSLSNETTLRHPRWEFSHCFKMEILQDGGYLDPNQRFSYYDYSDNYYMNSMTFRGGTITLGENYILLMGPYIVVKIGSTKSYRLFYPDFESRPYLYSMDFLDYENITGLEMHWKWTKRHIELLYNTRYLEEKSQVLYGPYFFSARLPSTVKPKEGVFKIEISLQHIPHPQGKDGELEKRRLTELYSRIKDKAGL